MYILLTKSYFSNLHQINIEETLGGDHQYEMCKGSMV